MPNHRPRFVIPLIVGVVALLIGILATYWLIYADYRATHQSVHFHANFALFINGQRFDLSGNQYMEDVGSCSVDPSKQTPRERVHLHNNIPDVVHVHATGVTWGDFFTNLGFRITNNVLITPQNTLYSSTSDKSMHFILNGKAINDPSNLLIGDEDRLLVSYGSETEQELAMGQYLSVPQTAREFDTGQDPATCSGSVTPAWKLLFWR